MGDGAAGVHGFGAPHQTIGAAHGDAAGHIVANVLGYLHHQLFAAVVQLDGVAQRRQLSVRKADVQYRADDLDHGANILFGHGFLSLRLESGLPRHASPPATISVISCVMAA